MPFVVNESSSFYLSLCVGACPGAVISLAKWVWCVPDSSVVAGANLRINLFVPSQRSFVLPSSSGNGARPIASKSMRRRRGARGEGRRRKGSGGFQRKENGR